MNPLHEFSCKHGVCWQAHRVFSLNSSMAFENSICIWKRLISCLVCSKCGFCESWDRNLFIHQFLVSWMSSLVRGPLCTLWVVKCCTQAWMWRARRKSWHSRSSSNTFHSSSGFSLGRLSNSLMTFASSSEVLDFTGTSFSGHISGLHSHTGPF